MSDAHGERRRLDSGQRHESATDTYSLIFKNPPPGITAFRLEVLPDESLPKKGPGRAANGTLC